jgi:hypothetical protein
MTLSKQDFLALMKFPKEWLSYDMYPNELYDAQATRYEPGQENGSEHDRNGAFHWWLKQVPTKEQLKKLVALTYLDPDQLMASDIRRYITKAKNCDVEILSLLMRP